MTLELFGKIPPFQSGLPGNYDYFETWIRIMDLYILYMISNLHCSYNFKTRNDK